MSFSEGYGKKMLVPAGKGGKGISRQNPRYNRSAAKLPKPLEKKISQKSWRTQSDKNDNVPADNDSVTSKSSFFNNVTRIGTSVIRNSKSVLNFGKSSSKAEADEFFFTNVKNKWRAEKCAVFKCDNDQDNFPTHIEWRGFSFSISQNTHQGAKPQGQDSIGVASHKNWEVYVLCDGHDTDGHLVSQGVCATLPHFILRRIFQRKVETNTPVEDELLIEAFQEAEETVCWSADEPLEQGDYVKVTEGPLKGQVGYIASLDEDEDDEDKLEVTVVVDNQEVGYQREVISEDDIRTPRYKGGSTCLCFVRNNATNKCKVAVLGDSRLMAMGDIGKSFRDEDFIDPVLMTTYLEPDEDEEEDDELLETIISKDSPENQIGYFTPQHNVHNVNERDRLKAYQQKMNGEYVVNLEEGYLVNPETKMQIQPTRGFGDVEMQSCGYSHVPDISTVFTLSPNTVLVGASDGIFDGELWGSDEEFLKYVHTQRKEENVEDAFTLATKIYLETTKRCKDQTRLDDISLFVFISPQSKKKYRRKQKPKAVKNSNLDALFVKRQQDARTMKSRRSTIQRVDRPGANLFRKFFSRKAAPLA